MRPFREHSLSRGAHLAFWQSSIKLEESHGIEPSSLWGMGRFSGPFARHWARPSKLVPAVWLEHTSWTLWGSRARLGHLTGKTGAPAGACIRLSPLQGAHVAIYASGAKLDPGQGIKPWSAPYQGAILSLKYPGISWLWDLNPRSIGFADRRVGPLRQANKIFAWAKPVRF